MPGPACLGANAMEMTEPYPEEGKNKGVFREDGEYGRNKYIGGNGA